MRRNQTAAKPLAKDEDESAICGPKLPTKVISMSRITANDNPQVPTSALEGHSPVARREPAGSKTMKNRLVCIVSCGVCFALPGCASEQRRFTGFLSNYSILEPHPTIPDALVYWNPKIDPREYKAVIVELVDVHFMNRNEEHRAKPEDLAVFRRFVTHELTTAISKRAAIVTEPGTRVLRCRLQVANLQLTRSIGEPQYPWVRPEYALGSAHIETDVRDSISDELVAAYVSPRGRAERCTSFFLASPPDRWEAAKTTVRAHIVTIGDLHGHRVINRGNFDVAHHGE